MPGDARKIVSERLAKIAEPGFPCIFNGLRWFRSEIIGITPGFAKPLILLMWGVIEEAIGEVLAEGYFGAKTSL